MTKLIEVSEGVFSRLEALAVGFDTPCRVIERLLEGSEGQPPEAKRLGADQLIASKQSTPGRLIRNRDIQARLSKVLSTFSAQELDRFCHEDVSKDTFDLDFALLVKVPSTSSVSLKRDAVKPKGIARWTWKFEFEKEGCSYAICTQWFPRHEARVIDWLQRFE
jgi:hypothetical protein